MKKRNLTNLSLNKKSISNLAQQNGVKGGMFTISCQPFGICGIDTDDCGTQNNCPTQNNCGSQNNCGTPTDACPPSISCQPVGICR
ncbi:hypothetical protein [Kordia sp.]|uniref:hypothetical protein n=1 Tax=Kordia sp. TaxID=1965332 RepID=UPI003B5AA862